jgi:dihydroxyacetone kinase-like predicted kinase
MNNINKNFDFFLEKDFSEYDQGDWVAIYNNKIVSHGKKLEKVVKEAKKHSSMKNILITKVKKTASYL